ncbi:hypothetical protein ACA910_020182 [Epithemia clementina (nom. ined.)]
MTFARMFDRSFFCRFRRRLFHPSFPGSDRGTGTGVFLVTTAAAAAVATTATMVITTTLAFASKNNNNNNNDSNSDSDMNHDLVGKATEQSKLSASCQTAQTMSGNQYHLPVLPTSLLATPTNRSHCESPQTPPPPTSPPKNRIVFLGTGSSTGCPMPRCPMIFGNSSNNDKNNNNLGDSEAHGGEEDEDIELNAYRTMLKSKCHVSNLAVQENGDPRFNRNYRNNPSLVISHQVPAPIHDNENDKNNDGATTTTTTKTTTTTITKNIIIDVGKTFREASIRWFPLRHIHSLDAVVLTHEHADASFGLDDLRGYQKFDLVSSSSSSSSSSYQVSQARPQQIPMPLFLSQHCLDDLAKRFTWLFPHHHHHHHQQQQQQQQQHQEQKPSSVVSKPPVMENHKEEQDSSSSNNNNGKPIIVNTAKNKPAIVVQRHVASMDVTVFTPLVPFVAAGLSMVPLPVMHGEDLVSYGFAFTVGQTNVVYVSDISRMLPETLQYIQTKLPPTDILVVDALHPSKTNPCHYSVEQAMALAHLIQPRKHILFVGMNCDSFLPHDEMNLLLQQYNARLFHNSNNGIPITATVQLAHDGLEIEC